MTISGYMLMVAFCVGLLFTGAVVYMVANPVPTQEIVACDFSHTLEKREVTNCDLKIDTFYVVETVFDTVKACNLKGCTCRDK